MPTTSQHAAQVSVHSRRPRHALITRAHGHTRTPHRRGLGRRRPRGAARGSPSARPPPARALPRAGKNCNLPARATRGIRAIA